MGSRLVVYRYSLRGARFAKYRFSTLHILHFRCVIPCLGSKSLLHGVVYTRSVKESEEITYIYSQPSSSKSSFRKIQIFELPLFYSLFRLYRTEESDCCDTGMFISVQVYSFRFVSLRKIQ